MATTFQLRLLGPHSEIYVGPAEAIMLPGAAGDFGVLSGHTKFVTELRPGQLKLVSRGKTQVFAVGGGFAEVFGEGVTVLADSVERPEEIDLDRARRSQGKAQAAMKDLDPTETAKLTRNHARLARALNRIQIAGGND